MTDDVYPGNVTILITKAQREAARNSGKTMNDWVGDILAHAASFEVIDKPVKAPEVEHDLANAEGFGASYNREENRWFMYSMPGAKPFGAINGYDRASIDFVMDALRSHRQFLSMPDKELSVLERINQIKANEKHDALMDAVAKMIHCAAEVDRTGMAHLQAEHHAAQLTMREAIRAVRRVYFNEPRKNR